MSLAVWPKQDQSALSKAVNVIPNTDLFNNTTAERSQLNISKRIKSATLFSRPGHTNFLFSGHKKFEISGHFSGHRSHKKRVFVISGAHNFGTLRAEAKITIRRHEVVYRLSSERKMIELEMTSTRHFNAEIWDKATFLMSCVTYS